MDTTTVRINRQTYNDIKTLANKEKKKIHQIIDLAIQHYKKIQYFQELNQSYSLLRDDQEDWNEEQNERTTWEVSLSDGIDE